MTLGTDALPYFHRQTGRTMMFPVDGREAIAKHPNEWSDKPWTDAEAAKAEAIDKAARDQAKAVADAEVVEAELRAAKARVALAAAGGALPRKPLTIPETPILAALALLTEHVPEYLSDAGHARHHVDVTGTRDRDQDLAANVHGGHHRRAVEQAAAAREGLLHPKKDPYR